MHKVDILSHLADIKYEIQNDHPSTAVVRIEAVEKDLNSDPEVVSQKGRE
jgi:hypothetical protein